MRRALAALLLAASSLIVGGAQAPPASAAVPKLVVIYMENHERSDITTSADADYLNGLRAQGIDFTHYYGVAHPSLPNYLALGNGSTDGKVGTDSITAGSIPGTTVWNQMKKAKVNFRVWEESMPSPCSSAVTSGEYVLKHNPATPFAQVFSKPWCPKRVLPYTASTATLVKFNFIAPNLCNDMHNCSIATGDDWLQARVPGMLAAGDTVVITWDEGDSGTNGGGNIYTVVVGAGVTARVDDNTYNHYSLLRAIEDRFALTPLGGAASATPLPLS